MPDALHIASDDAFAQCIFEIAPIVPEQFERCADAPEATPLRILVDDGRGEYAMPWPYFFRDGDFYSIKSGRALHDSIAVRGWREWGGGE